MLQTLILVVVSFLCGHFSFLALKEPLRKSRHLGVTYKINTEMNSIRGDYRIVITEYFLGMRLCSAVLFESDDAERIATQADRYRENYCAAESWKEINI